MARPSIPDTLPGAAVWYATEMGWRIHPVHSVTRGKCTCGRRDCTTPGKHPILKNWQEAASNDPVQVREWWAKWPTANIGLATGRQVAVDLDVKPGEDGWESWRDLGIADDGAIVNLTPSGGAHLIFTNPNGTHIGNRVHFRPGLDIRAENGNLVLPPSRHTNGKIYSWELSAHPEDRDPGAIPDDLLAMLIADTNKTAGAFALPDTIPAGTRDDTLFKFAAALRAKGMTEAEILDGLKTANGRCDPPLNEAQLRKIAGSAGKYEAGSNRGDTEKRERPKTADYIAAAAALGYTFRLNELDDGLEVNGEPMSDAMRGKIRAEMRDIGYWRVNVAEDAFLHEAFHHRYHPVRDYLNGLEWDGQDRIAELSNHFSDRHDVFFVFLPLWLRGAVAKALDAEQNAMLVLDGLQGIGKSFWVRWLCSPLPGMFTEGPIDPSNKDSLVRLMTTFLWEVAELGSTTRRADREALKHFISMRTVTVRKPYGRFDIRKPALASLIGTINNENGFLTDPTGSRRFMVATLTGIDWAYSETIDPNQIWAQAVAEYRAGKPWQLDAEQALQVAAINHEYELDDPVENLLREHFDIDADRANWWTSSAAILRTLQSNGLQGNSRANQMMIAATMTRLGLEKRRGDGRKVGYVGIKGAQ